MKIKGKIVYVDLSGGFYGIESEEGRQFLPDEDLPSKYRKDGLKVKATVKHSDVFSMFMWGESVSVSKIEKLDKDKPKKADKKKKDKKKK